MNDNSYLAPLPVLQSWFFSVPLLVMLIHLYVKFVT